MDHLDKLDNAAALVHLPEPHRALRSSLTLLWENKDVAAYLAREQVAQQMASDAHRLTDMCWKQ